MAPDVKVKNASFHRAYILKEAQRFEPALQDWLELLERLRSLPMADRTVDGIIFEPSVEDGVALMGMHKPINPDFMTSIDNKDGTVADLMKSNPGDGEDAKGFAYSTALAFLKQANVFAISLGAQQSPRAPQLAKFLQEFLKPAQDGAYWKVEPLVDDDEIRQLKQSVGLLSLSSTFTTRRSLFEADDASTGVVSFGERMADRVGGDMEITIEVKLSPASRSKSVKTKFLDMVMGDLPRLSEKGSHAKVKAMISEGVEQELSLVEHSLAAEFEISKLSNESHQFSELLHALGNVSAEMEDRVKAILEG